MKALYYSRDGQPTTDLTGEFEKDRTVAKTKIGDVEVSTVFLVIDHSHSGSTPILFETMIFGGDHDQWTDRYATEAEAIVGHRAAIDVVLSAVA